MMTCWTFRKLTKVRHFQFGKDIWQWCLLKTPFSNKPKTSNWLFKTTYSEHPMGKSIIFPISSISSNFFRKKLEEIAIFQFLPGVPEEIHFFQKKNNPVSANPHCSHLRVLLMCHYPCHHVSLLGDCFPVSSPGGLGSSTCVYHPGYGLTSQGISSTSCYWTQGGSTWTAVNPFWDE